LREEERDGSAASFAVVAIRAKHTVTALEESVRANIKIAGKESVKYQTACEVAVRARVLLQSMVNALKVFF
jgi:hypothetical protein